MPATGRPTEPRYRRVTWRRGVVDFARLAPDGRSIVYAAAPKGEPLRVFLGSPESPDARAITGPEIGLLALSPGGELALAMRAPGKLLDESFRPVQGHALGIASLFGGEPHERLEHVVRADYAPDGSMVVLRRVGGRTRVERPPGKLLWETPDLVDSARLSPDGRELALITHPVEGDTAGMVTLVDAEGHARPLSHHWVEALGLAWSPDGNEVWFTAYDSGERKLWAVDRKGRERLVAAPPGSWTLLDAGRDGRVLLARQERRYHTVSLAPGEARERDLSWFDNSMVCNLSGDGRKVLFVEGGTAVGGEYRNYVRPTDGSPPVPVASGMSWALSPDARRLLAADLDGRKRLLVHPVGAGESQVLPAGPVAQYVDGGWFADGGRIAFTAREAGRGVRVWIQALDGSPPRPVTDEGFRVGATGVSPDGAALLVHDESGHPFVLPLSTQAAPSRPRPLGALPDGARAIGWADGGRAIVLSVPAPGGVQVLTVPRDGGKPTPRRFIHAPDDADVASDGRTVLHLVLTDDLRAYAYLYLATVDDLYLVEGLR